MIAIPPFHSQGSALSASGLRALVTGLSTANDPPSGQTDTGGGQLLTGQEHTAGGLDTGGGYRDGPNIGGGRALGDGLDTGRGNRGGLDTGGGRSLPGRANTGGGVGLNTGGGTAPGVELLNLEGCLRRCGHHKI